MWRFLFICRFRKDFQELVFENTQVLHHIFCSKLAPRGLSASWRTPCAMDISVFLQKNMPKQLAKTTYTLPRPGTTTGVPGAELFGEEWAHQLVSHCLLPPDVSVALDAPLRQPLSASIGRRTSTIPGAPLSFFQIARTFFTPLQSQVLCLRLQKCSSANTYCSPNFWMW